MLQRVQGANNVAALVPHNSRSRRLLPLAHTDNIGFCVPGGTSQSPHVQHNWSGGTDATSTVNASVQQAS